MSTRREVHRTFFQHKTYINSVEYTTCILFFPVCDDRMFFCCFCNWFHLIDLFLEYPE